MNDASQEQDEKRPRAKLSSPPPPLGRTRIGRFDVIYPLAQGGMASVHVGRLSGMAGFEKLVAIKAIHPHLSGDEGFVKMFLDEARLAARIHHPNVGEVIEVGEDRGLFYMVCELIVGQSLRNVFRQARAQGRVVPHQACADIAAKVCQALQEAHDLRDPKGDPYNLVHRDISPRNILVSYNGFVKLIDFGIAWAQGRMSHTDAGTIKGKLGFMPPEQIKGQALDRRSDIFSLGVVLYLMVTGSHPFPGHSDAERMHKILNGQFRPPGDANPELNPELDAVILRAMATDPDERYANAAEMGRELMGFVHANSDPPGSWDSSTELSKQMHELFEQELIEHREQIRIAAEEAGERPSFDFSEHTPVDEEPSAGRASDTDLTTAGTPNSMKFEAPGRRSRMFKLGLVGGAVALAAIAVLIAVVTGSGDDRSPAEQGAFGEPALAGVAGAGPAADAGAAEPSDTASATSPETIRVVFDVRPKSAVIAVDGKPLEEGARELELVADGESHGVAISAEGYKTVEDTFVADVNQKYTGRLEKLPKKGKHTGKKKPGKKPGGLGLIDSPY